MRKLFIFLLCCVLHTLLPLQAQDSLSITLRGIIVDATNRKHVADALVHVNNSRVATMSNIDGRFSLKVSEMPETMTISTLGYKNTTLTREQLEEAQPKKEGDEVKEIRIQLTPTPIYLEDVYVYSPQNLLYAAISKIKENCPSVGQLYDSFYRETIKKRNKYVSVSEAVMQLYKTSYEDQDIYRDKAYLLKGRSLMSQRAKDTISVHVKGGPTESLLLDLVKNRGSFLCPAVLNDYSLKFEAPVQIDNRAQCVIAFYPTVEVSDDPLFSGRIYIEYQTLTITRIEYNLDISNPAKVTSMLLAKKPFGMRFRPKGLNIVMNYYYDGKQSRLSYLKTTYTFDCDWKKRGFRTRYEAVSEMLITGYQEPAERPRGRATFKSSDLLSSEVKDFDDPDFWKDYNILMPSESLEHAMKRLKKN